MGDVYRTIRVNGGLETHTFDATPNGVWLNGGEQFISATTLRNILEAVDGLEWESESPQNSYLPDAVAIN